MASCEDSGQIDIMWHLSWDHEYMWGLAILDTFIEKWSLKWRGLFKEFKLLQRTVEESLFLKGSGKTFKSMFNPETKNKKKYSII